MRRELRLAALLCVLGVLLGACGAEAADKRGVGVRSINTDIGLGVEVQLGAPGAVVVQQTEPRRPSQQPPRFTLPPIIQPTAAPMRECPAAGPFDFPAKETGTFPTSRPPAGTYPWKIEGKDVDADIDEFETRKIFDIQDDSTSSDAFTFKQTQTFLIGRPTGTLTTTFRVVPTSPGQTQTTRSDVGRGVFIVSVHFEGKDDEGRTVTGDFNPRPAVQLIAFPVKDGAGVGGTTPTQTGSQSINTSSGTDPSTGAQLTITGKVKGKMQVDACGKRVDSWFTDAVQRYTFTDDRSGQTQTYETNYDYGIAPQYGGMLVFEHTEAPNDSPAITVNARVGKVPGEKD
jgi:hypothetical protein